MDTEQKIPWKRLTTEGAVIVVSILLAFAIDAWWEERQERRAQLQSLARVAAEIEANTTVAKNKVEALQKAIDSTSEYLAWVGPEPLAVSVEDYSQKWTEILEIGMFALVRRATDEYLGMGSPISEKEAATRDALLAWYAEGDLILGQYELLRDEHAALVDYNVRRTPLMVTMSSLREMQNHPVSKFRFDPADAMADPTEESLLAVYLLRMEFVVRRLDGLLDRQAALVDEIQATIDAG